MTGSTHILTYKGYVVICDGGLYYLALNSTKKFFSFQGCKDEIDRLTKDEPVFVKPNKRK